MKPPIAAPTNITVPTNGIHGIRYQVTDVARAIDFYTRHFGFSLEHEHLPEFAVVTLGGSRLLLSGPGASGSRPLADGRAQRPGGDNRLVAQTLDLPACLATLQRAGIRARNTIESGPAGCQVQVEDPDGNVIELFEPAG